MDGPVRLDPALPFCDPAGFRCLRNDGRRCGTRRAAWKAAAVGRPTILKLGGVILGDLEIRRLTQADAPMMADAFAGIGWRKPASQYLRYFDEQEAGQRECLVAMVSQRFAGYVTVNWFPAHPTLAESGIPEIQDLNVLPEFRRQRIASRLLDQAEALVAQRSSVAGIAVGLHPGYNAAQRLYVKRGYVPDGRGVTWHNRYVEEGAQVILDDDFVLHLTKRLVE